MRAFVSVLAFAALAAAQALPEGQGQNDCAVSTIRDHGMGKLNELIYNDSF